MIASMMKPATNLSAGDLNAALEDTIAALTNLDADKLEQLEGMVSKSLAGIDHQGIFTSDEVVSRVKLDEIQASHRLLGTLLASTSLNLNVLERLHSRNSMGDVSWAL